MHSDDSAGKKEKGSTRSAIDPAESEKRSWIQRRMCDLYIEKHGADGALVNNSEWAPCYQQAKEEWEKEHEQGDQTEAGARDRAEEPGVRGER